MWENKKRVFDTFFDLPAGVEGEERPPDHEQSDERVLRVAHDNSLALLLHADARTEHDRGHKRFRTKLIIYGKWKV